MLKVGGYNMSMSMKRRMLSCILAVCMLCGSLSCTDWKAGGMQVHAAGVNVARNRPVTVSEVDADTPACTGDLTVDGIIGTEDSDTSRWSGGVLKSGNPNNRDQWLMIDLGAERTNVESIKVHFYKLVWSKDYIVQTRAQASEDWTDVCHVKVDGRDAAAQNPTDEISSGQAASLNRYVRFFFKAGSLNAGAGGNKISIREIEIFGTQEGVSAGASTAGEALSLVPQTLSVSPEEDALALPTVEGYEIGVHGSEVDCLVGEDGSVSPYRIGTRSLNVIVKAVSRTNPQDMAKKNVTVVVADNTMRYPELFAHTDRPNARPDVLPSIQEWHGGEGNFILTDDSRIIVNDRANVGLREVARQMSQDLAEICGKTVAVTEGASAGEGDIYLESQTQDVYGTGEEGYFLINDENGIQIYSATKTGVLYGTVTVEQMLYQDAAHEAVPKGVIRDYPLYAVRGIMFDVARIPTRMQFLQDYVRIFRWYKLNTLQLHLNDTQWSEPQQHSSVPEEYDEIEASHRLESELFPSLAKQRAKFEMGELGSKYKGDYEGRYDYYYSTHTGREGEELYYTKEEYRALEAAAGQYGIELVAELDTPGHSTPYNKYVYNHQEEVITSLARHGYIDGNEYLNADGTVKKHFYTHNPSDFELFAIDDESADAQVRENAAHAKIFIRALFDEYLGGVDGIDPLFTSDYVNAGVDEYWDKNTGNNKEAFRRYMNEMYDALGRDGYGKEVCMWGSLQALPGQTPVNRDIILFIWNGRGEDDPVSRMNEGFRVVNIPQLYLYTTPGRYHKDMVNETHLYYNWEPELFDGNKRAQKGEPLLLGTMAALWGDANRAGTTEADLNERYLRLGAMVSEKTWGGRKEDDTFLSYEQKFDRLREGCGTKIANTIKSETNIALDYDIKNYSEKEQTIYDTSGNGYHGTVTGGTVVEKDGEAMLRFDGGTTIETPLETLGYPYTVSFDVYLDGTEANAADAALFAGYDGRLFAAGRDGKLGINRSHFTQSLDYAPESGKKSRITIVGTYQATKLYVDGAFQKILYAQGSDPDHGGSLGNETWTDKDNNFRTTFAFPLRTIGAHFSGCLGNIRAYKKALSAEEIAAEGQIGKRDVDVARNCRAYADNANPAYDSDKLRLFPAWKATDGDGHVPGAEGASASYESRWHSSDREEDFLMVDLLRTRSISKVVIDWEKDRYAADYKIMTSLDGKQWTEAASVTGNTSALTEDAFAAVKARYVKMQGVRRRAGAGEYAIFEIRAYESVDKTALYADCRKAKELLEGSAMKLASEQAKSLLRGSIQLAEAYCADVLAGQEEIDEMQTRLAEAADDFEDSVRREQKEKLDQKIAEAGAYLSEEAAYEPESFRRFKEAYHAATEAGAAASPEACAELAAKLEEAIRGLIRKGGTDAPSSEKKAVQLTAPAVTSVKSQKTNVKITFGASANAASYQLYRTVDGVVQKAGEPVTGTEAYDEHPVGGKEMAYHVVAISGDPVSYTDSAAGSAGSITLPKATKRVTAAQVKGKRAVSVKWKKVKGASSYLVFRAEGKKGAYKLVKSVKKKLTCIDSKKLKKGKTYAYKVVAATGGKYSPMQPAKKAVKIK